MNWREKKYEIDVNFIGEILGKDGRVNGPGPVPAY